MTQTVGVDAGHTDVSLWFPATLSRTAALCPDATEFAGVRWWSPAEVDATDPARFDPHFGRFLAKRQLPRRTAGA